MGGGVSSFPAPCTDIFLTHWIHLRLSAHRKCLNEEIDVPIYKSHFVLEKWGWSCTQTELRNETVPTIRTLYSHNSLECGNRCFDFEELFGISAPIFLAYMRKQDTSCNQFTPLHDCSCKRARQFDAMRRLHQHTSPRHVVSICACRWILTTKSCLNYDSHSILTFVSPFKNRPLPSN